jgi:hypothetical protein
LSHSAKRQYLLAIIERYQKSGRKEKKFILNEFCSVCGYNRKYALRLLNSPLKLSSRKRGRQPKYGSEVKEHLVTLWLAMGRICSKRVKRALPEWLEYYGPDRCGSAVQEQLLALSHATIDRILKTERRQIRGISTTRPASYWYKSRIPIQAEDTDIGEPGFITSDTVSHCGESAAGSYVSSVTVTDIASTWTVNRAVRNKTQEEVKAAISTIENHLPFQIKHFKSDSGSEFMNRVLFEYLVDRESPVLFFRSRPYQKNDNCHVEQKNFTHVRTLFGYERIESLELVELMNEIYTEYWNPLQNFFLPTMKLKLKKRDGSKVKKIYDEAKTPFRRLMESSFVSEETKRELTEQKKQLNPFHLRAMLDVKLAEFKQKVKQLSIQSEAA